MTDVLTENSPDEEAAPKKAFGQILKSEIREGKDALERPVAALLLSGLSAGLDLGFSLLLMAVMWTRAEGHLGEPWLSILVGNMYSAGFVFVILGRSELFTEQTTLAVLPVLDRKVPVRSLLRLWGAVYVSNLIGAAIFARLVTLVAPSLGIAQPIAFGHFAREIVDHSSIVILFSAVLAGWLMGLLSWLVAAGRDTISQIVLVWLVTSAIGFLGLHHVILGTVEVLSGAFAGQGISMEDVSRFLLFATVGNILGGSFFVALIKYGQSQPEGNSQK
jgi:formate/nitrite transporter FocA (FNT family)